MPTASRQLAQEVMEQVLSDAERNLLRVSARSMEQAVGLYGRQYGGEDGVRAELARIREKVQGAIVRRVERADAPSESLDGQLQDITGELPAAPPVRRVLPSAEVLRAVAGKAPGRVVSGRRDRIGAAGAAPPSGSPDVLPPTDAAPAASARPSSNGFERAGRAPAGGRELSPAQRAAREFEERLCGLLAGQRMTGARAAAELGCAVYKARGAADRLIARGVVERMECAAFDWPGARRGRPSRVLRLVDEPEGALPVPEEMLSVKPRPVRAEEAVRRPVRESGGPLAPTPQDVARSYWQSFTPGVRLAMARIALVFASEQLEMVNPSTTGGG